MENSIKKTDNRGVFAIEQWQEMKKAGGIAPGISEIETILQGGNDDTLYTREEVISRISNYFRGCITDTIDNDTGEVVRIWCKNPTKSGLALSLGLSSQTLIDYVSGVRSDGFKYSSKENSRRIISNKDFDVLRKAYSLIEMFYEERLAENRNNAGVIFWLNNLQNNRWSNEQSFKFDYQSQTPKKESLGVEELRKIIIDEKTQQMRLETEEELEDRIRNKDM